MLLCIEFTASSTELQVQSSKPFFIFIFYFGDYYFSNSKIQQKLRFFGNSPVLFSGENTCVPGRKKKHSL